jgi:hypothetical protein
MPLRSKPSTCRRVNGAAGASGSASQAKRKVLLVLRPKTRIESLGWALRTTDVIFNHCRDIGSAANDSYSSQSLAVEGHSTPLLSVKRYRPSARITTAALTSFITSILVLKEEAHFRCGGLINRSGQPQTLLPATTLAPPSTRAMKRITIAPMMDINSPGRVKSSCLDQRRAIKPPTSEPKEGGYLEAGSD